MLFKYPSLFSKITVYNIYLLEKSRAKTVSGVAKTEEKTFKTFANDNTNVPAYVGSCLTGQLYARWICL